MASPPSLENINAAYQNKTPDCIHVANGIARIRDKGSDGDETRLPQTGEPVPLWDGTVDALVEADRETVKRWLDKIGNYLIHEGSGEWHQLNENRLYNLKRFPLGYKLYTRIKGPRKDPRKDSYLYGSATERCREFRSPEEFVLHAKWLAFGQPRDAHGRALCGCCYCSRRSQGEITPMLREKVSHLNVTSSSAGRTSGISHEQAPSYASQTPIMAKDYTHLSQGEGVSRWVESTVPQSYEQ